MVPIRLSSSAAVTRAVLPVVVVTTLVTGLLAAAAADSRAAAPANRSVVSENPVNWTPDVDDGMVRQTATVGGVTVAVGDFTQVTERGTGTTFARQDIVAFDSTGAVSTTFHPQFNGTEIYDVIGSGDGHTAYVAGAFSSVDGAADSGRVVRIDVVTGALDPAFRSPGIDKRATEVALVDGMLVVGGAFTTVGGQPRTQLVALDPVTGADTGAIDLTFAGTQSGGLTTITRMAAAPDGSRLVAIGNFTTVDGESRPQVAVVDLTQAPATLSSWATERYGSACNPRFDSYLNDVAMDPTGTFFVVVTTGGYSGGPGAGVLCDSVARWDLGTGGPGQDPTWVDYTGGDTVTAVAVTGPVVYVGGHFRWMNNPFAHDDAGPGGVSRKGLAALDSRNGLPLTWNPGRLRGWGVYGFRLASAGLWIGHDTDVVGGEQRHRLALMPAAGGSVLPAEHTGSLPGRVRLLGRAPSPYTGHRVLYRINAGGQRVLSLDGGPDWAADTSAAPSPLHGWGSVSATWNDPTRRTRAVPAGTPQAIFSVERADPASSPEMSWDFPVKTGTSIVVRLYFASGCSCTDQPGDRLFDVAIDGVTRLDNYDIVADVGQSVGTMKSFALVSDGTVDIDFTHVVENPLVNGIEILRAGMPPDIAPSSTSVATRWFNGTRVTRAGRGAITARPVDWAQARGAFMVDHRLYTGWADGTLYRRTLAGGRFSRARAVELNGLQGFRNDVQSTQAMFYDRSAGRLYFNQVGESGLFYRYFTPQSAVVGATRFAGPGDRAGITWSTIRGAFLAGGRLYFTTADGRLRRVAWSSGRATGPVTTVSGPAKDGHSWRARALFLTTR